MGQAAGQLEPTTAADPLDGALVGGGAPQADGHADDLLSELAGAEIDRMLAAADVETDPVLPPPPAVPPPVEMLSAVLPEIPAPGPVAPAEIARGEPAKVDVAPAPVAPSTPVLEVVAATPPVAVVEPAVVPVAEADLSAVLADATADRKPTGEIDLGTPVRVRLASLLLRPLTFLNGPLDALPDTVRDMIGKVAVVTLVNSIAVITYVAIFRRHG